VQRNVRSSGGAGEVLVGGFGGRIWVTLLRVIYLRR